MGGLQAIIGLLLIFIVPGYLVSWLFLKKLDFIDRFGVSVGLSICINVLISLILGFLGFLNVYFIYAVLILLFLIVLVVIRNEIIHYLKIDYDSLKDKKNLVIFLILVVLLIFNFILVYQVHSNYSGLIQNPHNDPNYYEVKNFNYPFPIHADEWTHLAKSVYFIENEKIGFVNPYLKGFPYFPNYEIGFDSFTSEFFLLTGLDPVLNYKYLAAIFMIINSLLLFIFVRKLTNGYIGLLSVLIFGTLKSNINILGNWFFVPMSMSLFLMFLFLYFLISYFEDKNKKYLFALIFVYLTTLFIYPILAILLTLITGLFLITNFYNNKIMWGIVLGCLLILIISYKFFNLFIPKFTHWTLTAAGYITFNVIRLYSPIFFILALIGLIVAFLRRYNKILFILFIPVLLILIEHFLGFTYLIPYTRIVYYFLLFLVPLSAIGLYFLLESAYRKLKGGAAGLIFVLVVVVVLVAFDLQNYYNIDKQKGITNVESKNLVPLYLLEEQDYEAINYVNENFGKGGVILTDPLIAVGVYPISQNHIVTMINSNLGAWTYDTVEGTWKEDPLIFFEFLHGECLQKEEIIKRLRVDFILSRYKLECSGIIEIYNKGIAIYDVRGIK
ncbi:MAG: hypothetical protein AABX29_01225 [Nanoarchaeota archaeon]